MSRPKSPPTSSRSRLSRNMGHLITESGLSDVELAQRLTEVGGRQVSRPSVYRWRNGLYDPAPTHRPAIAAYFKIDLDTLVHGDVTKDQKSGDVQVSMGIPFDRWDQMIESLVEEGPIHRTIRSMDLDRLKVGGEELSKAELGRRWGVSPRTAGRTITGNLH